MKTTKEKADELVKSHLQALIDNHNWDVMITDGLKCAILSVKHTIEVLEVELLELSKDRQENEFSMWVLESLISEQTELLAELESKL